MYLFDSVLVGMSNVKYNDNLRDSDSRFGDPREVRFRNVGISSWHLLDLVFDYISNLKPNNSRVVDLRPGDPLGIPMIAVLCSRSLISFRSVNTSSNNLLWYFDVDNSVMDSSRGCALKRVTDSLRSADSFSYCFARCCFAHCGFDFDLAVYIY